MSGSGKKEQEEKATMAREQLIAKSSELGRIPKKDDFDDAARSRIKASLGPWPRALEAAGLKSVSESRQSKLKKKKKSKK